MAQTPTNLLHVLLVWRTLARWPNFSIARTPALYVIGSVAAYWSFGRIVSILA